MSKKLQKTSLTRNELEMWAEDLLMSHYPFYAWHVQVNGYTGQLEIRNYMISSTEGMSVNLHKGDTASALQKKIVMFGGELLERAGKPRRATQLDAEAYLAEMEQILISGLSTVAIDRTNKIK